MSYLRENVVQELDWQLVQSDCDCFEVAFLVVELRES